MESLSPALDLPVGDAALANLYYDALKDATRIDRERGTAPGVLLHGRNLAWWTADTRNSVRPAQGGFIMNAH
jgi:hypothetical protein